MKTYGNASQGVPDVRTANNRKVGRNIVLRLLLSGALAATTLSPDILLFAQGPRAGERWVGAWATAVMLRQPTPPAGGAVGQAPAPALASAINLDNQTLRQIIHVSLGGDQVRVVFSNAYGTAPLEIGAASVALRATDAAIKPQSARALMFGGRPGASIPPGALLVSDPARLTVPALADVAVDLHLPGRTEGQPVTVHGAAWQTSYVSRTGNFSGASSFPVQTTTDFMRAQLPSASWFFLSRVEVVAPAQTGAVVALGDSITDGTQSGINTNNRWPDHLARRFARSNIKMGVLNVGIGGNRVLADGTGTGISALARFDRDVLAQPGVTHVILFEGINDIQGPPPNPSAEELIAGHRQIIERAHTHGLKIYGATLTPFRGWTSFSDEREAKRQAVNQWMRTAKMYDAVIDFDAVVRDPKDPSKMRAEFDPGDHLHMNGVGYKAMADAIDLALFKSGSAVVQTTTER